MTDARFAFLSCTPWHIRWGLFHNAKVQTYFQTAKLFTMNGDGSPFILGCPERDSAVDCLVLAVVPYFLVLWVAEGKSTNIFPNGQIIYAINVTRTE